jgi:hypothetical protein
MRVLTLHPRRTAAILAFILLAAGTLLLATKAEGESSIRVAGIIRDRVVTPEEGCQSPVGVCLVGNFYGSLTGPNEGTGTLFLPQPDGVIFGKSKVVVHDRRGDIFCTSSSSFDLANDGNNNPFSDLCIITGGTGYWAGAQGWFHAFGNGGPGGTSSEYRGTIRRP